MRTVAAFLRDERGSYTIEFCLWIPVFFFFLAATIDASLLYLTHNANWNAARDLARRITTGEITVDNWDAHVARVEGTVLIGGNAGKYFIPEPNWTDDEAQVVISIEIGEADAFGIFTVAHWWYGYSGDSTMETRHLTASVTMRKEPALI